MPAKRKKLPRPCPKCGSEFGTVQIVFFHGKRRVRQKKSRYDAWNQRPKPTHRWNGGRDNGVFKIGHYDPVSYAKTKKENERYDNYDSDEEKKRKLKTSQRKWCSFRSWILEDSKFSGEDFTPTTKNYPFFDDVWIEVYDYGWQMIPKKSKL